MENSDTPIRVENVSKRYDIRAVPSVWSTLTGVFNRTNGQTTPSEIWALRNVSFEVKRGEVLGIMGPNGAGKSTLLKVLSKVTEPTSGRVSVVGRVSPLIEVGAGFHPELTGRENIYLNAAIMGMSKVEIRRKFDPIVEFSELDDFIDTPVKKYSSGMYVRLGFAVAVHVEPEILLVDEVLSVGDAAFQMKCFQKIAALRKSGVTMLVVSHNEAAIRNMANRAICLGGGKIVDEGSALQVTENYMKRMYTRFEEPGGKGNTGELENQSLEILSVEFLDGSGVTRSAIPCGEKLVVRVRFNAHRLIKNPKFGITFNPIGQRISTPFDYFANFHTGYEGIRLPDLSGAGMIELTIDGLHLPALSYNVSLHVFEDWDANLIVWHGTRYSLDIVENENQNPQTLMRLPHQWRVVSQDGSVPLSAATTPSLRESAR